MNDLPKIIGITNLLHFPNRLTISIKQLISYNHIEKEKKLNIYLRTILTIQSITVCKSVICLVCFMMILLHLSRVNSFACSRRIVLSHCQSPDTCSSLHLRNELDE